MQNSFIHIQSKLNQFIDRIYFLSFLRGLIIAIGLNGLLFSLFALMSFVFDLTSNLRSILFILFVLTLLISSFYLILIPLFKRFNWFSRITLMKAAKLIYELDKKTGEKIINAIELQSISKDDSSLVAAAILQLELDLKLFRFQNFTERGLVKRAFLFLIPLVLIFMTLWITGQQNLFKDGSKRLLSFSKEYTPKDFRTFHFLSSSKVKEGADYKLEFEIWSDFVLEDVMLFVNDKEWVVSKNENNRFSALIRDINSDLRIVIKSGRYTSEQFTVRMEKVPRILDFELNVKPPKHTKIKSYQLKGNNKVSIPEHSEIGFLLEMLNVNSLEMLFRQEPIEVNLDGNLGNAFFNVGKNDGLLKLLADKKLLGSVEFELVRDQFPQIEVELVKDSLVDNGFIAFGKISDDYGFNSLEGMVGKTRVKLELKNILSQRFYYAFEIDSAVEVKFRVTDNDAPNGYKSTFSKKFDLNFLNKEDLLQAQKQKENESILKMEEWLKKNKAFELKDEEVWKQKEVIEELSEELEKVKNLNNDLKKRVEEEINNFEKNKSNPRQEEIKKRIEETNKNIEELLKALRKNQNKELSKLQKDKVEIDLESLEKELERSLDFLKELQMERILDSALEKLEDLENKEGELALKEETQKEEVRQEEIAKELDKLEKELNEFNELAKDIEKPVIQEDVLEESKLDVSEALKNLKNKKGKQSNESQKKAQESLKKAKEKLQAQKDMLSSDSNAENIEDLRQLLKNVVQLSVEEENLIKEIRNISSSDREYIPLMKGQAKLYRDSKIINDSLNALMKRVPTIENFVLKELESMEYYFDLSNNNLKNGKPENAVGEMQFVMLASNNLALMLNTSLEQMQSQKKGNESSGDKSCNKPGESKPGKKGLKKMQQGLYGEMKGLSKEKGKSGANQNSQESKEIAKMMARQEMIRMKLGELGKESIGTGGNSELLKEIEKLMLENEKDLADRIFDAEFLKRQKELEMKLLEFDQADLERELDNKRRSETNRDIYEQKRKKALDVYLQEKYKGIEGLELYRLDLSRFYNMKMEQ